MGRTNQVVTKERATVEDEQVEIARKILREATADAAQVFVDEMQMAKHSSDRLKAAERVLREAGVIDREGAQESAIPSKDVVELIKAIGEAFGVQKEDVMGLNAKNVSPKAPEKVQDPLSMGALNKIREDR